MAGWKEAKAAATKILGDKAQIPEPKAGVTKGADTYGKALDAFNKSREDVETKLLALQDACTSMKNAVEQFEAIIDKSDFGLDDKSKDDAKKISQAQKILGDYLEDLQADYAQKAKDLGEVDKHLILVGKYKLAPS